MAHNDMLWAIFIKRPLEVHLTHFESCTSDIQYFLLYRYFSTGHQKTKKEPAIKAGSFFIKI